MCGKLKGWTLTSLRENRSAEKKSCIFWPLCHHSFATESGIGSQRWLFVPSLSLIWWNKHFPGSSRSNLFPSEERGSGQRLQPWGSRSHGDVFHLMSHLGRDVSSVWPPPVLWVCCADHAWAPAAKEVPHLSLDGDGPPWFTEVLEHIPSTCSTVLAQERRLKNPTVSFAFLYVVVAGL